MSRVSNVFVFNEGPGGGNNPIGTARDRANRRLQGAFRDIEAALAAGKRDVAASKANFVGQELDQIMRDLSQSLLAGGGNIE